jgi:X-X-X-Leu-X-X-Gly heptad repeat protein
MVALTFEQLFTLFGNRFRQDEHSPQQLPTPWTVRDSFRHCGSSTNQAPNASDALLKQLPTARQAQWFATPSQQLATSSQQLAAGSQKLATACYSIATACNINATACNSMATPAATFLF